MRYWLMKSEPDVFSIDDLQRVGREPWTGVRNYQARNFMWKDMRPGDAVLFYHSNAKPPGIAGTATICSEPYPDPTQFDPTSPYFDPKANEEKPRWWLVDVEFAQRWETLLPLETLRQDPVLCQMTVCLPGTRLSITPVEPGHFERACALAHAKG